MACHVGILIRLPTAFSRLIRLHAEFAVERRSVLTRKNRKHDPLLGSENSSPLALGPLPRLSPIREARAAGFKKDCGWKPPTAGSARHITASLSRCGAALCALQAASTPSLPAPWQGASAEESRRT